MNSYQNIMKQYMEAHPIGDGEALLELFYRCYTEANPVDNDSIRQKFATLRGMYAEKGEGGFDSVFYAVCDLCMEYEHLAFLSGFRAGMQLAIEVDKM